MGIHNNEYYIITLCEYYCSEFGYDIKKTIFEFLMFCMIFGFNILVYTNLYTLTFSVVNTLTTIIKNMIGKETDLFFKKTFIYLLFFHIFWIYQLSLR